MPGEARAVGRIEREGDEAPARMRTHDGLRRGPVHIAEVNPIAARLGEQSRNQSADLAGAQDQYTVHRTLTPKKGRILPANAAARQPPWGSPTSPSRGAR